jgi:phosphoglycerate dehydrogenase-like enzyme
VQGLLLRLFLLSLLQFNAFAMTAVNGKSSPDMDGFVIGLIGMGDMGKMYARRLSSAGWT